MDNLSQAREWQKFAAMDLKSAEYLVKMHPIPVEIICYHCQQSAEKYLKAFLVLHGIIPPKIHDLDELCKLCSKFSDAFTDIADHCSDLTAYGIQPRYPMELMLEKRDMLHISRITCFFHIEYFLGKFILHYPQSLVKTPEVYNFPFS